MDGEKLKYRASHGINHDDILLLKENKEALIQYFKEHAEDIRIISAQRICTNHLRLQMYRLPMHWEEKILLNMVG